MELVASEFHANQDVIIYSQSQGGWVPARVESCNADDSVTVRYASGHTKLVPIEYQATHLKPADEPPDEPTMIRVNPQLDSDPYGPSSYGQCEEKASQYSVGQDVMVFSESSNQWVPATISEIVPNGCITVHYHGSTAHKTLEPARHHHLRPMSMAGPRGVPDATASVCNFGGIDQFGGNDTASADQAGVFKFDLAQLCNDADMPAPPSGGGGGASAMMHQAAQQQAGGAPQYGAPAAPQYGTPQPVAGQPQSIVMPAAGAQPRIGAAQPYGTSFVGQPQSVISKPQSVVSAPRTVMGQPQSFIGQPRSVGAQPASTVYKSYVSQGPTSYVGGPISSYPAMVR